MGKTVAAMLRAWEAVDPTREAAAVISRNPEALANLNRAQLRKGKGRDGNYLLRYSEDPFFKTPQAALQYATWKQSLGFSDPEKPFDVADLYINGFTHNGITAIVRGNVVAFDSQVPWSNEVESKTTGYLGLTEESKAQYRQETLLPQLRDVIRQKTGVK